MTSDNDPYLWLEDVTGEAALDWVRAHNAVTEAELASGVRFEGMQSDIREVLDTDARIPYVRRRGEYLYNFWRDGINIRGLWRRTTLEQYQSESPEWDVLVDLDALAEAEGENWVWKGTQLLRPLRNRALISLSRGGADAAVVREFDIERREFLAPDGVDSGFYLPEAKTDIDWIDIDTVYVGTDTGEGSLTDSGYPRLAMRWKRGTPLSSAETIYEGESTDVAISASHDPTPGFERDFVTRSVDFYNSRRFQFTTDGELVLIDTPEDAGISIHREWLLIRTKSPWTVEGTEYATGTLLAARYDDYLAGSRDLTVVFEPDEHSSLDQYSWTRDHLILVILTDVRTTLRILTPSEDRWDSAPFNGLPELTTIEILDTDPDVSNEYFLNSSGYTSPATLLHGVIGESEPGVVKSAPAFFDAESIVTQQFFATSVDGTQIPYFVVRTEGTQPGPTLLYGYGGFEVSMTPSYSGSIGRAWLTRGGTYVVANIRGGGEYGPGWHTQVVKAGRHKVHEDFAAVACDLVERKITTPELLAAQGGSNGGLLMGIMLTKYPELFGAIVCQVPLLDMRRFHLLLAGASWMAEYGDPDNADEWSFISEYSPYQNIDADASYPPILIATSTRDDRVHPAHARKMAARLEELGKPVLYFENIEGGHGGAADNAQLAYKSALTYEFLWQKLSGHAAR
ncbi:prolyl oligopeptidase family protein [Rhodococcus sp. ARC_M6]|uniref:prolyl oligopeptidase family serine peptidase n=1 Tax=Rhodococcus sp. ARC_M6 TaxID=2928852 RepID=UPI001FB2B750|nr:prolyl oligopeptidase family serine peptidase [Rhodococcus sp. ARC_M6]MCJ0902322.1 prolyl oligopeptidase family serine peptidase [Rhodococcus sp. ARC_M6]